MAEKPELRALPDRLLSQIIHNLQTLPNETVDFRQPHLRQSLVQVYPLFLVLYGLLVVAGTVGNVAMVAHILCRRLFRDPICAYVMNIGVCNIFISLLLLPLSLAMLLIQNWIFGSFLCYFIPMLQDVPLHTTMWTLMMVAVDRYRLLVTPHKPRPPPFVAVVGIWVLSVCVVLPYAVYMHYTDLQVILGAQFEGVGICAVNLDGDKTDYIRVLFIALFALPLALVIFLLVRVSVVLATLESAVRLATLDTRSRASQLEVWIPRDYRYYFSSNFTTEADGRDGCRYHNACQPPALLTTTVRGDPPTPTLLGARGTDDTPSLQQLEESEVDVAREKRNQRYIVTIVTALTLCLSPLMILRLVKNMVVETAESSAYFDVTFISIVWVAFLPTLTTPAVFASWKLSRSTKEQLREYLCCHQAGRRCSLSQELPPTFYSCHARTAHLLPLQPTLVPISPPHTQQVVHTPALIPVSPPHAQQVVHTPALIPISPPHTQ
ncbi:uncharacterized protein [Panulirus ornatus]|uniref:uncharacterized protein n=1 Tax=Panulirus ornatus TaxID=150431 RepID=UPI003A8430B5